MKTNTTGLLIAQRKTDDVEYRYAVYFLQVGEIGGYALKVASNFVRANRDGQTE